MATPKSVIQKSSANESNQLTERATKKRCLDSFGANSSTNITIMHQQQQIETLQYELDHERSSRLLDNKSSHNQIKKLQTKVKNLESDIQEMKAYHRESNEQRDRHMQNLKDARDNMQRLNSQLQLQLREAEQEVEELNRSETEYTHLEHELDLYKAKVESYESMEAHFKDQISELKEQLDSIKTPLPEPESPLKLREDAPQEILRELNRCRRSLADTERQNRQLNSKLEKLERCNTELVQKNELYAQASKKLETTQLQLSNVTRQYETLFAESKAWNEFSAKLSSILEMSLHSKGPPEPATIIRHLQDLKTSTTAAKNDLLRCKTENKKLREQIEAYKNETTSQEGIVADWNQKSRDYESKIGQLEDKLAICQQQSELYQRESNSLRELIQTFEEQMVEKKGIDLSKASNLQQKTFTDQLNLLQIELDKNRNELDTVKAEKLKLAGELDRVRDKFSKLRDALMTEREKVAQAEDRAVKAEQLSGKGSFDPTRTRVLHFSETPLVMSLKEEVRVLKRQLESHAKTPQSGAKGMAADPDKLNQRLKENFKEQIALFREGVYLMTGYKVDMLTNLERPTFRLRSVYAEREEDHLLLQWPKDEKVKSLDILNTDLAKVLSKSPSYDYMTKFHSLPAFLASVQLSLFENQTVM